MTERFHKGVGKKSRFMWLWMALCLIVALCVIVQWCACVPNVDGLQAMLLGPEIERS